MVEGKEIRMQGKKRLGGVAGKLHTPEMGAPDYKRWDPVRPASDIGVGGIRFDVPYPVASPEHSEE